MSFHSDELDEMGGCVPASLAEQVTSVMACMRGTAAPPLRCVALRGEIGQSVSCVIYEFRPSPCREFGVLAAIGQGDEACNDARRRHRLPPLGTPAP